MSDAVSEAVIAMMAAEIKNLREDLRVASTQGAPSMAAAQSIPTYQSRQVLKRTNLSEANLPSALLRRQFSSSTEHAIHQTSRVSSMASTTTTAVSMSRSSSLATMGTTTQKGFSSGLGSEKDAAVLIAELRVAEAERDAALAELAKLRHGRKDYQERQTGYFDDVEDDVFSSDDEGDSNNDHTARMEIIRSISEDLSMPGAEARRNNPLPLLRQMSFNPDTRVVPVVRAPKSYSALQQNSDHQRPTPNVLSRVPSPLPRDPSATLPPLALEQLRFDILARLPIPNDYPEEPLHPIIMPSKMDLSSFLDQSTGSTKKNLEGRRLFLTHEVTWCADRPYHGYIFEPRQISRPSSAVPYSAQALQPPALDVSRRWAENSASATMRKRPVEVFHMHEGDWFYVGSFKAYSLPDMTVAEFEELDDTVKNALIHDTVDKWTFDAEKTIEIEDELCKMYEAGSLKLACVGLQCVGFNHSLSRIMLEQSRRLKLIRANTD